MEEKLIAGFFVIFFIGLLMGSGGVIFLLQTTPEMGWFIKWMAGPFMVLLMLYTAMFSLFSAKEIWE